MSSINSSSLPLLTGENEIIASHNPDPGRNEQEINMPASQPDIENKTKHSSGRLHSLDVFRGLTILGMLLVNNIALGGATPKQFLHAAWNRGVNFADLVFPWFLFIAGVAIPYAFASHIKKGMPTSRYLFKAASRALILFLLGCFVDSSVAKQPVIGLGVLQLIGLAYFAAVLIYQLPLIWRIVATTGLLLVHWTAIRFISVPNLGKGVFLETGNLISYLNQTYLQQYHLKGIISVIPTAALVLIGAAVGDLLRDHNKSPLKKTGYLFTGGMLLAVIGWLWNLDLPFNKPLWTSSYILFCAGFGSMLLGLLYFVIDVKGWQRWSFPLTVFGTNAILAYVLPIIVKVYVFQGWMWPVSGEKALSLQDTALKMLTSDFGNIYGGWLYTCGYIMLWWLVLLQFYRKKIFLKV